MDSTTFETKLAADGYEEISAKSFEARPANGAHVHEFSVRGLVVAGEFIVACNGTPRSYTPGEVFEVAAGELHTEAVGSDGAQIISGRKY